MSASHEVDDRRHFLAVIRVWAATAWADGRIDPTEAAAMRRLIAVAPLDDAGRAAALGYLDRRIELETADLGDLDAGQREGVYRAAVRLARIDHAVAVEERAFLVRLRRGLALADDAADRIEAAVASALA